MEKSKQRGVIILLCSWLGLTVAAFSLIQEEKISQPIYDVKMELNVMVPMRDGVRLSADIYRPDAPGRFPVLLERTPYNNNNNYYFERGTYYARRGYVFMVQDTRGRHDSEGEWYPLIYEAEDGYDTQEWAGTQPWSTGKVGTIGASYVGWTQWYPAPLANKHLACMVPYVAPPNPFKNFPYENGVLFLAAASWMLMMDGHTLQTFGGDGNWVPDPPYKLSEMLKHLPVSEFDRMGGRRVSWFQDWMEHDTFDDYWKRLDYQSQFNKINVPTFHITGWYDGDFPGAFMNFPGMVKGAKTEHARRSQKLLIGPWAHAVNLTRRLTGVNFGQGSLIDLDRWVLRWFDHWLKGIDNGILGEAPIRIFVMGANDWRDEWEWPLERTRWTKYYLHSTGRANSLYGDGLLSTTPPGGDEPPDRYRYDPEKPAPAKHTTYGPIDLQKIERRMDVLVYQTPQLEDEVELTGPVTLKLYAGSSAPDTDFFARLSDVFPNGFAMGLGHGIIRARFRDSLEKSTLLEPGKVYEYTIELWPTSNLFHKGHRIRIEITSSAFPDFARNLNTGKNSQTTTEMQVADQTIYHDAKYSSHVILPVIPVDSSNLE